MRRTYLVATKSEPRTEMRVFQIMDRQRASILAFSGRRLGDILTMMLTVDIDDSVAERLTNLLGKLQAILYAEIISEDARIVDQIEP